MLDESPSNTYGMTVLGLVILVILIKMIFGPISKRVNHYLEKHPGGHAVTSSRGWIWD